MNTITKTVTTMAGAVGIAALMSGSAFADCFQTGEQVVPPHRQPEFHYTDALRGQPLPVLRECLLKAARNEDIAGRDVQTVGFERGYTSSRNGNFDIVNGTAGQNGNDLTLANKTQTSFATAVIASENGVSQLENGNFAIVDLRKDTHLRVYQDEQAYQRGAAPTVDFY